MFEMIRTAGGLHFVIGMVGRSPEGPVVEGGSGRRRAVAWNGSRRCSPGRALAEGHRPAALLPDRHA